MFTDIQGKKRTHMQCRTAELSSLHVRMKTFMYAHKFLRIQ